MDIEVYVPTRGRIDKQYTAKYLHLDRIDFNVTYVVPFCEYNDFIKAWPGVKVHSVPDDWRIGDIRQHIVTGLPGRWKVMLDDDLKFARRAEAGSISQVGMTYTLDDANTMISRMGWYMANGWVHGGISTRNTNHFCEAPNKINTRVYSCMFMDCDIFQLEGIEYNKTIEGVRLQEREDFHVTLDLLELGYSNIVDFEFMVGDADNSVGANSPGGVSRYRTIEFMEQQTRLLERIHPTVSMFWNPNKSKDHVADARGTPDVRIGWARACGKRASERKAAQMEWVKYCDS